MHSTRFARILMFLPLLAGSQLLQPYLLRVAIDRHITPAAAGETDALVGFGRLLTFFALLLAGELALRFGQIYLMQLAGQRGHKCHGIILALGKGSDCFSEGFVVRSHLIIL